MTMIGLLCLSAQRYEERRVARNMTTEHYQKRLQAYRESEKDQEGTPEPEDPEQQFMGPTLIIWYVGSGSGSGSDSD